MIMFFQSPGAVSLLFLFLLPPAPAPMLLFPYFCSPAHAPMLLSLDLPSGPSVLFGAIARNVDWAGLASQEGGYPCGAPQGADAKVVLPLMLQVLYTAGQCAVFSVQCAFVRVQFVVCSAHWAVCSE